MESSPPCFQVVSPQAAARDVVAHAILAPGVDDRVVDRDTVQQRVPEAASRRRREHLQPLRLPQHQHESGPKKRHRDMDLPWTDIRCFQESCPHDDQATTTDRCVRWRLPYGVLRQCSPTSASILPGLHVRTAGKAVASVQRQLVEGGHCSPFRHQLVLHHRWSLLRVGTCCQIPRESEIGWYRGNDDPRRGGSSGNGERYGRWYGECGAIYQTLWIALYRRLRHWKLFVSGKD